MTTPTCFWRHRTAAVSVLAVSLLASGGTPAVCAAAEPAPKKAKKSAPADASAGVARSPVKLVDGIVQPRRPIVTAIADAIQFLRKADGGYVPGRIDGELAGYFMAAHVNPDGTRSTRRQLSFPARQHAYFIRTFLHYHAYTGEREWLLRARDLADWNIAHSTPAGVAYPYLPYSAHQDGKPTGSADQNSIETDKPAFLGSAYLDVYESTGDQRYLEAARKIAATLAAKQRPDGSWPFRVIPEDGTVFEDMGGAPVFFVEFFERMLRHDNNPAYAKAREGATRLLIQRNVEEGQWGTYHEDIKPKTGAHLSAEPMSFTADYLFRASARRPELLEMGRRVLRQMEARLVHTSGHAAAPAPAVAEQATYAHIMPGHTARYCLALTNLYRATGDEQARNRAFQGFNAATYMQSENGLFRTYFYDTARKSDGAAGRPDWYSQHLYTVCHLLESNPVFPERVPEGENRILGRTAGLRDVQYAPGSVRYATLVPAEVTLKLGFAPKSVQVGGRALTEAKLARDGSGTGWNYDVRTKVLTIRHPAGAISVGK